MATFRGNGGNDMKEQAGAGATRHDAHRQIVTEEVQDQVAVFERLSRRFFNLTHGLVKRLGWREKENRPQ